MRVVVCDTHLEKSVTLFMVESVLRQHKISDIKNELWSNHNWPLPLVQRLKLNEESGDLCDNYTLSDYNILSDCVLLYKTNWELSAMIGAQSPTGDWDHWHKKLRMLQKDQEELGFGQMEFDRQYELLKQEEEADKDKLKQLLHQCKGVVPYQEVAKWMESNAIKPSTIPSPSAPSKRRRLTQKTSCTEATSAEATSEEEIFPFPEVIQVD